MVTERDWQRLFDLARRGYFRVRPVFRPGVDPLTAESDDVIGYELIRGGRRIYMDLGFVPPQRRAYVRESLFDLVGQRTFNRLRNFFDPDLSPRDDARVTIVYRDDKPVAVVYSAPGLTPRIISARDFPALIRYLSSIGADYVVARLNFYARGEEHRAVIIGSRERMSIIGRMIQAGELPLDLFERRGNILFLNADHYTPEELISAYLYPVTFLTGGVWVESP